MNHILFKANRISLLSLLLIALLAAAIAPAFAQIPQFPGNVVKFDGEISSDIAPAANSAGDEWYIAYVIQADGELRFVTITKDGEEEQERCQSDQECERTIVEGGVENVETAAAVESNVEEAKVTFERNNDVFFVDCDQPNSSNDPCRDEMLVTQEQVVDCLNDAVEGVSPECIPPECADGVDNDNDGKTDLLDEGCLDVSADFIAGLSSLLSSPFSQLWQLFLPTAEAQVSEDASNPDIAADPDFVYIAYEQGGEIKVQRGEKQGDGSTEFSEAVTIDDSQGGSEPQIFAQGDRAHVVFEKNDDIYYARSTADANSFAFEEDTGNLSNNPGTDSTDHKITGASGNIYVTWLEQLTSGNKDPFVIASKNNGGTFGSPINLYSAEHPSGAPDADASGNKVVVCWDDKAGASDSHRDIFCRTSSNSGDTFGKRINVSNTKEGNSIDAQVGFSASTSDKVLVTWLDSTTAVGKDNKAFHVFFSLSNDGGKTYAAPQYVFVEENSNQNDDAKLLEATQDALTFEDGTWTRTCGGGPGCHYSNPS